MASLGAAGVAEDGSGVETTGALGVAGGGTTAEETEALVGAGASCAIGAIGAS